MKYLITTLITAAIFAIGFAGCGNLSTGLNIEGQIEGSENLSVVLEHINVGEEPVTLARTSSDDYGNFSFDLDPKPRPGIYRIRIGAQGGDLILTGEEDQIRISGNMDQLAQNIFEVEGSEATKELVESFKLANNREFQSVEDISAHIDQIENAYAAAHFAMRGLRSRPEFVEIHNKTSERLIQEHPGTKDAEQYAEIVVQLNQQANQQANRNQQQGGIQVGMEAPDIEMEGPDGEIYRLSDLRGNVVLLDFWAAWCRPCRIANPKIVEIYNQYKDQGFKVFNVSLDGLDPQARARLSGSEEIEQQLAIQKKRWTDAIEQDGLDWPYHVSELRRWQCSAAQTYGVRAIPRTYLIDRDGKIAVINPRAQTDLESELQKLL